MFRRLAVPVAPVLLALLVSACSSVTPARFQRGFIVNGHCLEQVVDENGNRKQYEVGDTPMERLFHEYLKEDPSSVLFVGYFFHQDRNGTGSGTGTADVVNRAAFLALDLPPARAMPLAGELRECLKKNNYEHAEEIFDGLAKEFNVDSRVEYYSKDGGFRHYHEYKLNDDGEIVLHGLTRNFHPNGMISNECFYRNGKLEGALREYSELGEPLTGE